jgi:hypothetical protein
LQLASKKMMMTSRGNLVMAGFAISVKSLQLPEGSNVYNDTQIHRVWFDEQGRIVKVSLFVNVAIVFQFFPSTNNPDIPTVCADIMSVCTGDLQVYADEAACETFMHSIPILEGVAATTIGANDVACRAFHAKLALALPSVHCIHTSPYNAILTLGLAGIAVTPCVSASGPSTPLPSAPVSRMVNRDVMDSSGMACTVDDALCSWGVVSDDTPDVFDPRAIELVGRMMLLIPHAGEIITQYVASRA